MFISRKATLTVGLAASAAIALAACGSSNSSTPGPSSSSSGSTGGVTSNPLSVGAAALDPASGDNGTHGTDPKTGGTLKILGASDVDYLDTSNAYYTVSYTVLRTFTRQLLSYPTSVESAVANTPVADLATAVPTPTNGGKTYTFTIKTGATWNAPTGARQITGADEIRGIKRLCNPVQQSGGLPYYENTIVGMTTFCTGFAKAPATVAGIKAYMDNNQISGLTASGNTVTFNLLAPAGDFTNIIALPFASPVPVEMEQYLPISNAYNQHTISDGPYMISTYKPAAELDLVRNPMWKASTDPLRHAYVNAITIKEGSDEEPVQQALETGQYDLPFDTGVPSQDLPTLEAEKSPQLSINDVGSTKYVVFNTESSASGGALGKVAVRQALQYCVAKSDISQIEGGSTIASPIDQILTAPLTGYKKIDPYNNDNGTEDSAKGKQLLAAAGYSSGLKLKFLYRNKGKEPDIAQALKTDMAKCGVTLSFVQASPSDFYTKYLESSSATKSGAWDLAAPGWNPDWQGNAARSFFVPLLDPRLYANGSTNYGAFGVADEKTSAITAITSGIDKALQATSTSDITNDWATVDAETMQQAPWIPLVTEKIANYHSKNVANWVFFNFSNGADLTNVWLTS